jgi:hypothetical protein
VTCALLVSFDLISSITTCNEFIFVLVFPGTYSSSDGTVNQCDECPAGLLSSFDVSSLDCRCFHSFILQVIITSCTDPPTVSHACLGTFSSLLNFIFPVSYSRVLYFQSVRHVHAGHWYRTHCNFLGMLSSLFDANSIFFSGSTSCTACGTGVYCEVGASSQGSLAPTVLFAYINLFSVIVL